MAGIPWGMGKELFGWFRSVAGITTAGGEARRVLSPRLDGRRAADDRKPAQGARRNRRTCRLASRRGHDTQRPPTSCTLHTAGTGSAIVTAADRHLAECREFSRPRRIKFHDARAPLEHLAHITRREQSANGLTHPRNDRLPGGAAEKICDATLGSKAAAVADLIRRRRFIDRVSCAQGVTLLILYSAGASPPTIKHFFGGSVTPEGSERSGVPC
jgi:hypothetical protein